MYLHLLNKTQYHASPKTIEYREATKHCHTPTLHSTDGDSFYDMTFSLGKSEGQGIIRCLFPANTTAHQNIARDVIIAKLPIPHVLRSQLTATDKLDIGKVYTSADVYEIPDVSLITESLLASISSELKAKSINCDLELYETISLAKKDGLPPPVAGIVVVAVGLTPEDEPTKIKDYNAWYDEEHMPRLAGVEGWRQGTRYKLVRRSGASGYAAPYLAVHYYETKNGLGGSAWKATIMSDWTRRIDGYMLRPPHRRVWELVGSTQSET